MRLLISNYSFADSNHLGKNHRCWLVNRQVSTCEGGGDDDEILIACQPEMADGKSQRSTSACVELGRPKHDSTMTPDPS